MSNYYNKNKKSYSDVELPTNPNLPSWIITPKEEKAVFERWRKRAFARCDELINKYIECSNSYSNPVDAVKKCQKINEESLVCVAQYQTKEYLDIEKDLFIKEKLEKKKLYKLYLEKQMQEKQQQQQQEKQG